MPARINIFIASPSDVVLERQYAVDVIGDFNTTLGESLGLQLVPRRWEEASPDLGDPQDLINKIAADADLMVVIFWRRLGTPTREHESGTLEEFEKARLRWKETGSPDVWVYFREIDEDVRRDPGVQLAKLLAFKQRFEEQRLGLSASYATPVDFRYCFQQHLYHWILKSLLPSEPFRDDTGLGVLEVLARTAHTSLDVLGRLIQFSAKRDVGQLFDDPIIINPPESPIDVYAAAMNAVQQRFWTTAFLDSVYWDSSFPGVLAANRNMLQRLQGNSGAVRRLFISSQPPMQEAEWMVSQLTYLEQHDRQLFVDRICRRFRYLRNAISSLATAGFETRVGWDPQEDYRRLRHTLRMHQFSPYICGLSVYDSFRVDVFQEGKIDIAGSVTCFTKAMKYFDTVLEESILYFETLWNQAIPFAEFLDKIDELDSGPTGGKLR